MRTEPDRGHELKAADLLWVTDYVEPGAK